MPGLTALYRRLASWSLPTLGGAYTAAITIALTLRGLAWRRDWVFAYHVVAPVLAVLAASLLFTVITWYRDEDTVTAAILFVSLTGMALILGRGISDIVFTGSFATLIFGVAGGFLALVVRALLLSPVAMLLIWGGRKLRRYFAPATLNDQNLP